MIVTVLQGLLLTAIGVPLLYLAFLSVLALMARKEKNLQTTFYRTFAVVVPAHNEELVIGRTLQSLRELDYPRELYDIIVVADNCTDATADLARASGALVLERTDAAQRGKGHALRWCFDILLDTVPEYDGIVVIDADSAVSRNFLCVMNYYLAHDARAIQASDLVAPAENSWSADAIRLGFTLYNFVRPLGRRVIGCSAGLRGNGMCFSADTLRNNPWEAYSLTEDLEYGITLLLHGVTVTFAPEAMVLATMTTDAGNAESQRARWEAGRFPVVRRFAPALLRHAVRHRSYRAFDALVDLVTPPFVNLFAVACLLALATVVSAIAGVPETVVPAILWGAVVSAGMLHVLLGLYASGADGATYRSLLLFPRYAVWKILLYMKLVRNNRSEEWIRTTREHAVAPR